MQYPTSRPFRRSCLFLAIAICAVPSLPAKPDLRLVAVYGNTDYPVKAIRPQGVEIEMPDGQTKALREGYALKLRGTAKPSLNLGYAPALYEVTRDPTNYHLAEWRKDSETYALNISGRVKPDEYSWWCQNDISKIWTVWALNPEKARMLIAWWNQKWEQVEPVFWRKGKAIVSMTLRTKNLPGHPVFLLWKDGRWIPPSAYQKAVAGSPFETIQTAGASPAQFDPGTKDALGLSPAHYLASWGHTDGFAFQPEEGLKKLRRARSQPTPLMLAAMHGHATTSERLIELGLNADDEMPGMGFDAGHLAILAGHREVIAAFIRRGYSRGNETDDGTYNPVTLALDTGRDDIVGLFDATKRDLPFLRKSRRQNLLFREAFRGHAHSIRLIIEDGAKPNKLIDEHSALSYAAGSGNAAAVEALLELGADPNLEEKVTPLRIATAFGNDESVQALLDAGADPNAPGGASPLENAVKVGDAKMVHALLEAGANPNPPTSGLNFGLAEIATLTDQEDIVGDLFAAGTVCKLAPEQAEVVLSYAISNDIVEMAVLALDQCVAPDFALFGEYPMSWVASYFGADAVSQWLTSAHLESNIAAPVFAHGKNLDARPKMVAGSIIPYTKDLFQRFGRMETKVRIIIDEEGNVRFPKVDRSLPAKLRLDLCEAIAQWRFTPPTQQGKPVKTQVVVPLVFDRPPEDLDALEMATLTTPPEPISQTRPVYPPALVRNRVEGNVYVQLIIKKDGRVDSARTIRTTHPLLSLSALQAVQTWRFKPGTKDGRPVKVKARIIIPFAFE